MKLSYELGQVNWMYIFVSHVLKEKMKSSFNCSTVIFIDIKNDTKDTSTKYNVILITIHITATCYLL